MTSPPDLRFRGFEPGVALHVLSPRAVSFLTGQGLAGWICVGITVILSGPTADRLREKATEAGLTVG